MCCCFGHSQLKSVCLPCSTSFCMLVFTDISSWHCLCTSHVQQHCYQMFGAVLCNFPSMHMIIFIHVCIRLSHDYIYIQCIHNKYIHTIYIYIYIQSTEALHFAGGPNASKFSQALLLCYVLIPCCLTGSLLITAVEAALRIPQQLPTSKPLRARFISFLHRMV